jgi:hypothetical protein
MTLGGEAVCVSEEGRAGERCPALPKDTATRRESHFPTAQRAGAWSRGPGLRLRQHDAFEAVACEALFPDPADFARSRAAASRMNGYVGGYGPAEQLEREIGELGLPEERHGELRRLHERGGRGSLWRRLFGQRQTIKRRRPAGAAAFRRANDSPRE